MLNELIIEPDGVSLPREYLALLHSELQSAGIWNGRLAVGGINAVPDMFYFLWHESGEVPVSMLIRRETFESEDGVRAAAIDFHAKWRKRVS